MTTLIWDGQCLVADTRATFDDYYADNALKIQRLLKPLKASDEFDDKGKYVVAVGFSGSSEAASKFFNHLNALAGDPKGSGNFGDLASGVVLRSISRIGLSGVAVIRDNGCFYARKFDLDKNVMEDFDRIADGSGSDMIPDALMKDESVTGVELVQWASLLDSSTGGSVTCYDAIEDSLTILPRATPKEAKALGKKVMKILIENYVF